MEVGLCDSLIALLAEPKSIPVFAFVGCGAIGAARSLKKCSDTSHGCKRHGRLRKCLVVAWLLSIMEAMLGLGVGLLGMSQFPQQPHLVLGSTLLLSTLISVGDESGRRWLRDKIYHFTYARFRAWLRSIVNNKPGADEND